MDVHSFQLSNRSSVIGVVINAVERYGVCYAYRELPRGEIAADVSKASSLRTRTASVLSFDRIRDTMHLGTQAYGQPQRVTVGCFG